jgi:hypothetical protein
MAVSYAADIRPLFRRIDIDHMKPRGILLDNYTWMSNSAGGTIGSCQAFADHANARSVYGYLTGSCQPQMPPGGPYWSNSQLTTYRQWMDDGFQP